MAIHKLPPIEYLRQVLDYNAETGELFWKERKDAEKKWNARFAGKRAGCFHPDGYVKITINGVIYAAHRLIWVILHGEAPRDEIDHIDGNGYNNRIDNLREATSSQNGWNTKAHLDNKLGVKGVTFLAARNKYQAQLMIDGRYVLSKAFDSMEDAKKAYVEASAKFQNEFARIN